MSQPSGSLLSGIQAVRLFWSVHNGRRRSSQLTQLSRSQNASTDETDETDSERSLSTASEANFCRICRIHDDMLMENICECKGTMGQIHDRCLRMWIIYQRSQVCEICRCKFRWSFESRTSNWKLVLNFCKRQYFAVLLRDLLNFVVLFGISVLQNAQIVTMIQVEKLEGFNPLLLLAVVGASLYDMYFTRWVLNRSVKAYNLVREYWILAHDDEFLGYFNEEFAVFGENQAEIENMLIAEYDSPDVY